MKTERAPRGNFAGKEDLVASMGRGARVSRNASRSARVIVVRKPAGLASRSESRPSRMPCVALRVTAAPRATWVMQYVGSALHAAVSSVRGAFPLNVTLDRRLACFSDSAGAYSRVPSRPGRFTNHLHIAVHE